MIKIVVTSYAVKCLIIIFIWNMLFHVSLRLFIIKQKIDLVPKKYKCNKFVTFNNFQTERQMWNVIQFS